MALKLDCNEKVVEVLSKASSQQNLLNQLGYDLTRVRNAAQLVQHMQLPEDKKESLLEVVSNRSMAGYYRQLAKDLDVTEVKSPLQIYKEDAKDRQIDSAKMNLADTYVNAFVNLGSGKDALMIGQPEPWVHKLKNEGLIAATASIGMLCMWDAELGGEHISEYLDHTGYGLMGALIGVGLYS